MGKGEFALSPCVKSQPAWANGKKWERRGTWGKEETDGNDAWADSCLCRGRASQSGPGMRAVWWAGPDGHSWPFL